MNCSKYVINKEVIWVINSICICDIKYIYLRQRIKTFYKYDLILNKN